MPAWRLEVALMRSSVPTRSKVNDRTPEEFTRYVKRLEELAWRLVGDCEEYQELMEDESMAHRTYVEALELLILMKSGGAD